MSGDTFKRALPLIAIGTLTAATGGFGLAAGPASAAGTALTSGPLLPQLPGPVFTSNDLFGSALKGLGAANDFVGASREASAQQAALDLQRAEVRLRESETALKNEANLEKALAARANLAGRTGGNPNTGSAGHLSRSAVAATDRAGGRLRTDVMLQDAGLQLQSQRRGDRWRHDALSRILGLGLLSARRLDQF